MPTGATTTLEGIVTCCYYQVHSNERAQQPGEHGNCPKCLTDDKNNQCGGIRRLTISKVKRMPKKVEKIEIDPKKKPKISPEEENKRIEINPFYLLELIEDYVTDSPIERNDEYVRGLLESVKDEVERAVLFYRYAMQIIEKTAKRCAPLGGAERLPFDSSVFDLLDYLEDEGEKKRLREYYFKLRDNPQRQQTA